MPSSLRRLLPHAGTALLIAVHLSLLAVHDLARRPALTLFILAVGFGALAWQVLGERRFAPTAGWILMVALLLRLLLLPLPPTLSDDVLRYVWDGKVLLHGANPYALAPEAAELAELRDPAWALMPHRDVEAVYPPAALALFSIAAALPAPLLSWKVLAVAIELAGCALLLRLAGLLGVDARRVTLYAWNPLVTLEVAGMGHVDAVGCTLAIATVWALCRGRRWTAAVAAAGSVAAKLVPILALPLWARRAPRQGAFVALSATLIVAALAPVVVSTGGAPPGWVRFGVSWEFNGPLYEPLWRSLDAVAADDAVKRGLDSLKRWSGAHDYWNRFYPWVYPQLLAKLILGVLLAAWLARLWRDRRESAPAATGRAFGALVLCSATVYPWYLLWVLPWAALCGQVAWLALSALILLSYLPQLTAVPLVPWIFVAVWLPFLALLLRDRSWSID